MKITDLEIDGFGVWRDLKITGLSRRVTAFCGPNEAGKTTVMQFIRSVLYGVTPGRRKRYLPPVDGGEPGGAVGVADGDLSFRAARYANRGADDQGRVTCTTPDGVTGGDRLLRESLGDVDEQTFTNVFAISLTEVQELGGLSGSRAAEWLYRLTSGIDRVSLHDVMQQLREQRTALLAGPGQSSRIVELTTGRDRLRSEIDRLRDQCRQWSQLAVRIHELDEAIVQIETEVRHAEHRTRTAEIAVSLKPNWQKRDKLTEQLALLAGRVRLPDDAVERLNAINADLEKRQREADVLQGQRRQLREEADRLGINELLVRNAARIDALGEQREWLESLHRQHDELELDARQYENRLSAEQKRLGEALGLSGGQQLRELSENDLEALQPHIDALRIAQKRLDQAHRDLDAMSESERSLKTQIESAIIGGESHGLPMDLQEAADLVARLRKRLTVEQRLDQARQHEVQLEQQSHDLLDDQVMPLWLFGWLLATFVLGALMLGLWALVPDSPFGKYGGLVALVGVGGAAFAWVFKYFAEDAAAERLDACQRQMEVVSKQIAEIEREKQQVDAELPMTDGSVVLRLQAAERHLAELENVLPVEAQRKQAGGEVQNADARVRQAQRERDAAVAAWKSTIVALGLPESLDPHRLLNVTDRFAHLSELEQRARHRRDDAASRRREYEAVTRRIANLAEEVGCTLAADMTLGGGARVSAGSPTAREARPNQSAERQQAAGRGDARDLRRLARSRSDGAADGLDRRESFADDEDGSSSDAPRPAQPVLAADALRQLDHLLAERRRQLGAIERREELRQRASQLKAEEAKHLQAVAAGKRRRAALFQAAGCDDEQQFRMLAADQHQARLLGQQRDAVSREILAAIGRHEPEETFRQLLSPEMIAELEHLWERANGELEAAQSKLKELAQHRGELKREQAVLAQDRTLAERQLDLAVVERQLAEARQSWREFAVVSRVLERIRADYEAHRQPETLAEASRYMARLTHGQYRRIWTPLAGDCLLVDTSDGHSLPVDVLSRGTREQLFLSVRLALVASFARRGANLPMVLDDVLVNFDAERTRRAVEVLCEFADGGHQVLMFTCHEHIWEIFRKQGADCRRLPTRRGRLDAAVPEAALVIEEPERAATVEPPAEAPRGKKPQRKRRVKKSPPPVEVEHDDWYDYPFVERVVAEPAPTWVEAPPSEFHEYSFEPEPPRRPPAVPAPLSTAPLAYILAEDHDPSVERFDEPAPRRAAGRSVTNSRSERYTAYGDRPQPRTA